MSAAPRIVAALLIVAGAACNGSSAESALSGSDTVFVEDFESGTLAAWDDGVDTARQRIVTDSAFAQSGKRYLAVTYPAGGDGGWLTHFLMPGYDSLYVSYWVRFPPTWVGGTKLIALYGSRSDDRWSAFGKAGLCPTGTDFFMAMIIAELGGRDPGPTRFYTYYPAMAREPDGMTCWGRYGDSTETYEPPLTLGLGGWHHIAFSLKLNAPGRADATQTFWIDDVRRGTWSGISLRNSDVLRLNAVQLTFNRGISGGPVAQRMYVDNLVATTARSRR
jgi:hypothetical protein